MPKTAFVRLLLSALIAFVCYAGWAYYANSLVTSEQSVLVKAALVQGVYSGAITLIFTYLLEVFYAKFGASSYCLPLIVPKLTLRPKKLTPSPTEETIDATLDIADKKCDGQCLPGALLSPLPALIIQSLMVIGVNVIFATPNLWFTVAPSIGFSAIYGYAYSLSLAKKRHAEM